MINRRNGKFFSHISCATLLLMVLTSLAMAYPTPSGVKIRWELEFEAGDFRLYIDQETGDAYWWMNYTVTNRTKRDRIWAPKLTLFADSGEILESGKGVSSRITKDLKELLGNDLIETQNEIIGDLLQGPENAREGLAIWPARITQVNEITMFIAGISGETTRVLNPITSEEVILYKTLQRDYLIRGDALARGSQPIELIEDKWILR